MSGFVTLDSSNPRILNEYNKEDGNVLIKEHKADNKRCYIYCSSNDLYRKDDEQDFVSKLS